MTIEKEIYAKLEATFSPVELEVINESAKHRGHSGDDGSGESHFHIRIAAQEFAPMSRIARHRAVHAALGADLIGRIHALGLDILPVNAN